MRITIKKSTNLYTLFVVPIFSKTLQYFHEFVHIEIERIIMGINKIHFLLQIEINMFKKLN